MSFESYNCICLYRFHWQIIPYMNYPFREKVAAEIPFKSLPSHHKPSPLVLESATLGKWLSAYSQSMHLVIYISQQLQTNLTDACRMTGSGFVTSCSQLSMLQRKKVASSLASPFNWSLQIQATCKWISSAPFPIFQIHKSGSFSYSRESLITFWKSKYSHRWQNCAMKTMINLLSSDITTTIQRGLPQYQLVCIFKVQIVQTPKMSERHLLTKPECQGHIVQVIFQFIFKCWNFWKIFCLIELAN